MSKHSPGPWEIHGDYTQQLFYVHGANNICDIHRGAQARPNGDSRFSRKPSEDEANARLIAAAPAMFDEIKAYIRECDATMDRDEMYPECREQLERMEAIVARVEGRGT